MMISNGDATANSIAAVARREDGMRDRDAPRIIWEHREATAVRTCRIVIGRSGLENVLIESAAHPRREPARPGEPRAGMARH
jgi:hypothetical protein